MIWYSITLRFPPHDLWGELGGEPSEGGEDDEVVKPADAEDKIRDEVKRHRGITDGEHDK